MKSRFLVTLIVVGLYTPLCFAGNLDRGSQTVQLRGNLDFDSPNGTDFSVETGYGQFINKNQEVGANIAFNDNSYATSLLLGGYGNLYFPQSPKLAPYVGGGLALAHSNITYLSKDKSNTALVFTLNGGSLYFITDQLAVDAKLNLDIATDDIYISKHDTKSTDLQILFGLKYFWGSVAATAPVVHQALKQTTDTTPSQKKSAPHKINQPIKKKTIKK